MKHFAIKYHNFIKENTRGYKGAILFSLLYSLIFGIMIFTMSDKPFLYQMEYNFIMFLFFLTIHFILSLSYFSFKYIRKAI